MIMSIVKWFLGSNPITAVLSWIGGQIPSIGNILVQGYQAKLGAENSTQATAAGLAAKSLELSAREAELQTSVRLAMVGRWYEPEKLMGYTVAINFGKLLIWDKVLSLGVTDPLGGFAATTATAIVISYFGQTAAVKVAATVSAWRASTIK